jgi:anti-anti-sigma regulatory factor
VVPQDANQTERSASSGGALDVDHRLTLSGELVQATVGGFDRAIRAALKCSPREIVVDLTEVGLIDEAGLTALLKTHLRGRQRGLPIRFVPSDHEAVRQLETVTGTGEPPA